MDNLGRSIAWASVPLLSDFFFFLLCTYLIWVSFTPINLFLRLGIFSCFIYYSQILSDDRRFSFLFTLKEYLQKKNLTSNKKYLPWRKGRGQFQAPGNFSSSFHTEMKRETNKNTGVHQKQQLSVCNQVFPTKWFRIREGAPVCTEISMQAEFSLFYFSVDFQGQCSEVSVGKQDLSKTATKRRRKPSEFGSPQYHYVQGWFLHYTVEYIHGETIGGTVVGLAWLETNQDGPEV